jgi:hypothetical protein
MKKHIKLIVTTLSILTAGLMISGCATAVGGVKLPQAAANFTPKHNYTATPEKAFAAVQTALENNHIGVASSDKGTGVIRSEVVNGPSYLMAGGMAGAQSTRYSFNVSVRANGSEVRINIIAKLESSINSGNGSSQWNDVTGQNPANIAQLETWLFEQIEAAL